MCAAMPRSIAADVLARQLLRSGTSVAANYRAACRARSPRKFVAKMGLVEEEVDESALWLELITEAGFLTAPKTSALREEADELTAIAVASIRTARKGEKLRSPKSAIRN